MSKTTMRPSILLLAGVLVGDTAAHAVAPAAGIDPREEAPFQAQAQAQAQVRGDVQPPAGPPATATGPAEPEVMQSGNPLWAIPLRLLSATRERPLFAPSRHPPAVASAPTYQVALAPPPPPAPPVVETPQLLLVGTVAGEAEGIGIFLDQTDKSVLRLKTGDNHKGWVLHSVERRSVVLAKGFATVALTLPVPEATKRDASSPGTAPPPPRTFATPRSTPPEKGQAAFAVPAAATPFQPSGTAPVPAAGSPITFGAFTAPSDVRR